MDIATLGVGIDPSKAVSGGATAVKAAENMAAGMNAAGKKAEAAEKGVGAAAQEMGKNTQQGADKANKAVNGIANNSAWSKLRSSLSGLATGVTGAFSSIGKGVLTLGAAFGALQAAMLPVMATIGLLKQGFSLLSGAIFGAADFEDYTTQWAQLLGSFDKANAKMKELGDIAAKTPFDLPGIVKGTISLQTLSNGALASRDKILMIGDAAAKAKQPFEEMADRIGQIYTNAKYGIEFIEQLKTTVSQGIISGDAFAQIKQLGSDGANDGGKNFAKIWSIMESEMMKAKNSMLLMSESTNGLFSTLSDGWAELQRTIGAALNTGVRPLVRALTEEIGTWTEKAKDLAPAIEEAATKAAAFVNVLRQPGGFALAMKVAWDEIQTYAAAIIGTLGDIMKNRFEIAVFAMTALFNKMQTPEFWKGMSDQLSAAAKVFVNEITLGLSGVAQSLKAEASSFGSDLSKLGSGIINLDATKINEALFGKTPVPDGGIIGPGRTGASRTGEAPNPLLPPVPLDWETAFKKNMPGGESAQLTDLKNRLAAAEAEIKAKNATSTDSSLLYKGGSGSTASALNTPSKDAVKQAKKDAADLEAAAKRVIAASETPLENYNKTMDELSTLQSKKMITDAQYAAASTQAAEKYKQAVKAAADETKQKLYEQLTPLGQLLDEWKDLGGQMKLTARDMAAAVSNDMTQGFTDMITGAKSASAAFADMAKSIVNDLARMATQMLVNYAIQKALGWAVEAITGVPASGVATTTASVHHTGGIVGQGTNTRTVPVSTFTNAPRYQHGGMVAGSGEVPIIAEPGEQVLNKDQQGDIKRRLGEKDSQQQQAPQAVTILNVTDMSLVEQHILANPGIILNAIGQHASKVRRSLRLT